MLFRAVNFMAYGQAVPFVRWMRNIETMGPADFFLAGSLAQAIGATVETPIDLLKSKM